MPKRKDDQIKEVNIRKSGDILGQITDRLAALDGTDRDQLLSVLEECLVLADQAREAAVAESQPWLAAWIDLQKASLHSDLAEFSGAMGRAVQIHTAMNLALAVIEAIPELPPDLGRAAQLYAWLVGILLRVRVYFEEQDQLQALDDLVRACAENLGQLLAKSQALKAEAADLQFSALVLDELEGLTASAAADPASRDLKAQAASLLKLAGGRPADLPLFSREAK